MTKRLGQLIIEAVIKATESEDVINGLSRELNLTDEISDGVLYSKVERAMVECQDDHTLFSDGYSNSKVFGALQRIIEADSGGDGHEFIHAIRDARNLVGAPTAESYAAYADRSSMEAAPGAEEGGQVPSQPRVSRSVRRSGHWQD